MKRNLLFVMLCFISGGLFAQTLETLTMVGVEDTIPAHYKAEGKYNMMRYCLNDPFNYDPNDMHVVGAETPSPQQKQVDDTTCFVALSVDDRIYQYYGEDSVGFWDKNPLANNVMFEFEIPDGKILRYLDVWGRNHTGTDGRNKNLIVELYNDLGASESKHTFDLSLSSSDYPAFKRVDLLAIGLDKLMLEEAKGLRIRHKERQVPNTTSDFLQIAEVRMAISEKVEEIAITAARGGEANYPNYNHLPEYLYMDGFNYNIYDVLSDTPDLMWTHTGTYTPGLDTAVFAVKAKEHSWVEIFVDLNADQGLSFIDLWKDERSTAKKEGYENLIFTLIDSVNNTSWSSEPWTGISYNTHFGRFVFPLDVPHNLLYNATSIKIENQVNQQYLLSIFEVRVGGYTRENNEPVAVAGPEQFVTSGDTVTLDASGSYDLDDYQSLEYTWIASGITLDDIHSEKPTFIAPDVTDTTKYTIRLKVSDGVVNTKPVATYVTVYPKEQSSSINENTKVNLRVFPNPSSANVYLSLENVNTKAEISIYTMMGQRIYQQAVVSNTVMIEESIFPHTGSYLVVFESEDKKEVKKIIRK